MRPTKVLFISQVFPPDVTAGAFRVSETAAWLSRLGFAVTVLAGRPHREQAQGEGQTTLPERVRVIRAPVLPIADRGGVWYLLQFLSFMLTAFVWGVLRTPWRVDHVIASSPPLFVGVPAWLLARLKRASFVLDVRDLWPDSAVATGQLPVKRVSVPIGHWLERFLYRRAQLVVCVSKPMQAEIQRRVDGKRRVEVIYNGVDTIALPSSQTSGLPEENPQLSSIVYAGNLGRSQGLEVLIEAGEAFPEVEFKLIGGGVRRQALEALAREIPNVQFTGPCSKQKAMQLMSEGSALFLHLRDADVFATTIPSKVFDYLALNLPILFGLRGEGAQILGTLPGNIGFAPDDVRSLVQAIAELEENYLRYSKAARENSSRLQEFTRENMTRRLASLLEGLASRSASYPDTTRSTRQS